MHAVIFSKGQEDKKKMGVGRQGSQFIVLKSLAQAKIHKKGTNEQTLE